MTKKQLLFVQYANNMQKTCGRGVRNKTGARRGRTSCHTRLSDRRLFKLLLLPPRRPRRPSRRHPDQGRRRRAAADVGGDHTISANEAMRALVWSIVYSRGAPSGRARSPLPIAGVVMDISLRNLSMHYIRIHFGFAPNTHIPNAL